MPLVLGAAVHIKTLTDETICAQYQRDPCHAYVDELLARHTGLIRSMACHATAVAALPPVHNDDIESAMRLSLLRAAGGYRPGAGSFRTYLRGAAVHAGQEYLRRELPHGRTAEHSLDAFTSVDTRDRYLCLHACPHRACHRCGRPGSGDGPGLIEMVEAHLSPGERRNLRILLDGGTEGDLARELGCSKQAANVRRFRLLRKVRKILRSIFGRDVVI